MPDVNGNPAKEATPPWASGPGEILQHGLSLLWQDSDAHRRLAMLSIDNAVELMIKTYLGLPKRVTGLSITRKEYSEFSESFPGLLDAIEKHANNKITGIDLGEIEWYHRLRNQLYHQGNGLTVEIEKVSVYAELARILFKNLFGTELQVKGPTKVEMVGHFLASWSEIEQAVRKLWWPLGRPDRDAMRHHFIGNIDDLVREGIIDAALGREINGLRSIRNSVVHGASTVDGELDSNVIKRLKELTRQLQRKVNDQRREGQA